MKYISTILLFLFTLISSGCGEDIDADYFYYYDLKVKFENNYGQNLLKDIECEDTKAIDESTAAYQHPEWVFIARNIYHYECKDTRHNLLWDSRPLHYVLINNEEYLDLAAYSINTLQSSISYTLSCEQLFGDKREHEFVAYYSKKAKGKYQILTGVTFDGVEQKVGDNARVTITIDR